MANLPDQLPERKQNRYDEIVAVTGALCDLHLNEEYKLLADKLTAELLSNEF